MKDYVKCITVADAVEILLKDCIRYVFPTTAEPTTEFIKLNNAINLLQLYPSTDVAPVRHGHWIKISSAGIYECSECGKNVMTSDIEAYEYCHGCGARMDGEDDDD